MRADPAALPADLYRAADVGELDRIAIEEFGIPGATLMDRAGRAAFAALKKHFPDAGSVCVVCGAGNNAGDGFVVARCAAEAGMPVRVLVLTDAARLKGDALGAFEAMRAKGVDAEPFAPEAIEACDVVVDGIFGTGLDREVTGAFAEAIAAIGAAGRPVLALDIPSGLAADTGRALGACVRAAITISFIGLKRGMFTGDARRCCPRVLFDDLQVPAELYARVAPAARRTSFAELGRVLGPRRRSAHKGRYGHVLVVGGEAGFSGAARLAGEGAARIGAWRRSASRAPSSCATASRIARRCSSSRGAPPCSPSAPDSGAASGVVPC
ncbi:MAG: NAD(P)H-hydrate epimerase [Gammaproteobacteria bacterium]|nr:NAD(P)H-hydrate epimerase [Gammaproteobacteria bacterium]